MYETLLFQFDNIRRLDIRLIMQSHDYELLVIHVYTFYIWHLGNISNFLEVNDACSTGN